MFSLRKKKDKSLENFQISAPKTFAHEGHLAFDAKTGFEARNLPPELQSVFQELNNLLKSQGLRGISRKEADFLMKEVGDRLIPDEKRSPRGTPGHVASTKTLFQNAGRSHSQRFSKNSIDQPKKKLSTKEELANTQIDNAKLTKQLSAARQDIALKDQQLDQLTALLNIKEEAATKRAEENATKLADLKSQLQKLQEDHDKMTSLKESAVAHSESLQLTIDDQITQLKDFEADNTELREALKKTEDLLTSERELSESLRKLLEEEKRKVYELNQMSAENESKISQLEFLLESRTAAAESSTSKLENQLKSIENLMKQRVQDLQAKLESETKARNDFQEDNARLKTEISIKERSERYYQDEKRQYLAAITRLKEEIKQQEEKVKQAELNNQKAKLSMEEIQLNHKNSEKMKDLLEAQLDKLREELEQALEKSARLEVLKDLKGLSQTENKSTPTPTPISSSNPPPAPPPAPTAPPPSVPSLKKETSSASSSGGLLTAIRGASSATTLKKVDSSLTTPSVSEENASGGLLGSLAQALMERRSTMQEDEDEEDELLWD